MVSNWTIRRRVAPKRFLFQLNIQYRVRPKVPLSVFFGSETFSNIFFSKGSPSFFDDLRQNGWKISKRPPWRANSVQLLGFSGTLKENSWNFEVLLLLFLSLSYSADLCCSRLVLIWNCSTKSPEILISWSRKTNRWKIFVTSFVWLVLIFI